MVGNDGNNSGGPAFKPSASASASAQQPKPIVAFKGFEPIPDKAAVQASGIQGNGKERGMMTITRSDGKEEHVPIYVDAVENRIMTENRDLRVSYEEKPDEQKALLNLALLITVQHWNRNQDSISTDYGKETRHLVSQGAEINAINQDAYGFTPLVLAIKTRNTMAIRELVSLKADVSAMSNDGATPLKIVAQEAKYPPQINWADIASLLLQNGAMVDEQDHYGRTPLIWACESGDIALVKTLLTGGANVNASGHEQGYTSLINASKFGNLEMTQLLMEWNADVNAATKTGITSLMWAAANGHIKVVKELLKSGADPTYIDGQGRTASDIADQNEQWEIAEIIRKHP